MVNIPGIENLDLNLGVTMAKTLYWLGYGLVMVAIMGIMVAIYFLLGYKYKVIILERRGMGDSTSHFIGKVVRDRAKSIKDQGKITKWKLLLARKKIEPPGFESILPGNKVFLYRLGTDTYVPICFNGDGISPTFSPLPQKIRRWEQLELQQIAQDYTKKSFMEQYGSIALTIGTVMFCLILVGVTIYYTYNHANGVTSALNGLTEAVRSNSFFNR